MTQLHCMSCMTQPWCIRCTVQCICCGCIAGCMYMFALMRVCTAATCVVAVCSMVGVCVCLQMDSMLTTDSVYFVSLLFVCLFVPWCVLHCVCGCVACLLPRALSCLYLSCAGCNGAFCDICMHTCVWLYVSLLVRMTFTYVERATDMDVCNLVWYAAYCDTVRGVVNVVGC
jgi:hypothetical protein